MIRLPLTSVVIVIEMVPKVHATEVLVIPMLMASMVAYFTAVEVEPEDIFDLIMEQDSIDHVERAGKGMAQVRGVGTDKGVGGRGEAEGTQESVRGDGGAAGRDVGGGGDGAGRSEVAGGTAEIKGIRIAR